MGGTVSEARALLWGTVTCRSHLRKRKHGPQRSSKKHVVRGAVDGVCSFKVFAGNDEVDIDALCRKSTIALQLLSGELVECFVPLAVVLIELSCSVLSDNARFWLLFRNDSELNWTSLYFKALNVLLNVLT